MKYIITDKDEVVVGAGTYHQILAQDAHIEGKVVRAGHCEMKDNVCTRVWGSSIGYGISSQEEDKDIINKSSVLIL